MYGFFDDKTHLYIVLEYMEGGTLYSKLAKEGRFSERETADVIRQIAKAVEYLHDLGIAHRDIKPENVVVADVRLPVFRKYVDCVISDGRCSVRTDVRLTVGLATTWLLRYSRGLSTTCRWICGVWG
jgi:serine/threonine protein kinase